MEPEIKQKRDPLDDGKQPLEIYKNKCTQLKREENDEKIIA